MDSSDADGPVITSVEAMPEYKDLQQFLDGLGALQENRDAYENLRKKGDMVDAGALRKLVAYLYNANLGEYESNGHFAQALNKAVGPPLDITAEQQDMASTRFKSLTDGIFERWYGESALLSDVDQLKTELGSLERGNITTHDGLKALLDSLSQVEGDFRSPEFRWVAATHIDLNGAFRILTRRNAYLRPDTVDYVTRTGDESLNKLRDTLAAQRTSMSGPLLDMKDGAALASGTKDLEVALENALNLPFMTLSGTRSIGTALDAKTRLTWKLDPLREGQRLMDIYQRFVDESLRDAPSRVQPVLSHVAQDQMRRHVQNLVAESQNFQPRTASSEALGAEDETLAEANNFKEVSDPHGPLLDMANRFGQLGLAEIRNSILRIMVLQSYNLLTLLDARLSDEDPYAARAGKFAWWNGKGSLAFDSYQVHNATELAEYLNTQRDRIKFLVQQADPLVGFLNTWLPTRGEAQARVITKWQKLVADFKQYDGKKPGASLASLEDFVLTRMDKITPENGCKDADTEAAAPGLNQDYFQLIRVSLRTDIIDRCRLISAQGVYAAYTQIADQFNQTLAGRFPFGPQAPNAPEAAQEAVTEFYALLDRNGKTARSTLQDDTRFGDSAAQALRFLDDLDKLRPLVVASSPDAEKEPPFTVDFIPHFRVNQGAEREGNQIIEWVLQVGGQISGSASPTIPAAGGPAILCVCPCGGPTTRCSSPLRTVRVTCACATGTRFSSSPAAGRCWRSCARPGARYGDPPACDPQSLCPEVRFEDGAGPQVGAPGYRPRAHQHGGLHVAAPLRAARQDADDSPAISGYRAAPHGAGNYARSQMSAASAPAPFRFDIEKLLIPISSDAPSGINLRYGRSLRRDPRRAAGRRPGARTGRLEGAARARRIGRLWKKPA